MLAGRRTGTHALMRRRRGQHVLQEGADGMPDRRFGGIPSNRRWAPVLTAGAEDRARDAKEHQSEKEKGDRKFSNLHHTMLVGSTGALSIHRWSPTPGTEGRRLPSSVELP